MKLFKQLFAIATVSLAFNAHAAGPANEAPDALVKRISQDVIETAKSDKAIQAGDTKKVMQLVETKILPYVDSDRMTSLASGRFWRDATPEQKKQLSEQFRTLLIYTYSGALSQIKNETVDFQPLRADPSDTEVEVRSKVNMRMAGRDLQGHVRVGDQQGRHRRPDQDPDREKPVAGQQTFENHGKITSPRRF
jgi:phospholipid transport system substrate-binding protein